MQTQKTRAILINTLRLHHMTNVSSNARRNVASEVASQGSDLVESNQ